MKIPPQHSKAISSLYSQTRFTPEELRKMPIDMLKQLLAAEGEDVKKVESNFQKIKEKAANTKLYSEACKITTNSQDNSTASDLSHLTSEEIQIKLKQHFKNLEDIPLAARGFKGLGRVELESMYRDLILKGKKRA